VGYAATSTRTSALPAGAEEDADTGEAATPDSTEQGQTQLTDSFDRRPIATMLHESRSFGLRDTTFSVQLRSFYLDRDNFDTYQSESWTGNDRSSAFSSSFGQGFGGGDRSGGGLFSGGGDRFGGGGRGWGGRFGGGGGGFGGGGFRR
jgi:hypothetical protein